MGNDWLALELADAAGLADLRVVETDVRVPQGPVLLGLDVEGHRHLLIPHGPSAHVLEDRGSRGVQILQRDLLDAGRLRRFADVHCLAPHLNELFSAVADEMLVAIRAAPDDSVRVARRVLDRWRELLRPLSPRLLGTQQIAGIFAELLVLTEVVRQDPARRIDCWTGPSKGRHDLRRGATAIEVKATLAREGRLVEIHGIEQLESPTGGELALAVVRLETAPETGRTVGQLRAELVELGVSEHELLKALAQAGYLVGDEEAYEHLRYVVREHRTYAVDEVFPRLVGSSFVSGKLPAGVLRVTYVVDLTTEPPTPLDDAGVQRVHRTLAGVFS
ncbi:MAG: PD-(D/E)XK motif protein [Solirubrobacteraceae bacterium]